MIWWSLLIWVATKLIEWLLSKRNLTNSEKEKVEHFILLANQAEDRAVSLGCVRGGKLP